MKVIFATRQLSFLILFVFIFISCEKYDDFNDQVQFLEVSYFGRCFYGMPAGLAKEVFLSDNEAYLEYFNSKRVQSNKIDCDTVHLPKIDFDNYSLIGKFTSAGGCHVYYDRKFVNNRLAKTLVYYINIEYTGNCKVLTTSMNWALIPKLDKGYKVEYRVEHIRL